MFHEIAQTQETNILHIDPLVSDHLQVNGDHLKILVPVIVIVIENSIPTEIHHLQDALNFITNKQTLHLLEILFSELYAIVLFLDPTLGIDSI